MKSFLRSAFAACGVVAACASLCFAVTPVYTPVRVPNVCSSPDGSLVAVGTWEGSLRVIDSATGEEFVLQPGKERDFAMLSAQIWLPSVAFSTDGKTLASTRANEGVKLWDVAQKKEKGRVEVGFAQQMLFSPDDKWLAARSGFSWCLADVATGKKHAKFAEKNSVLNLTFSPDGKYVLAMLGEHGKTAEAKLYDIGADKVIAAISCKAACFAPNTKALIVSHHDGSVSLYDPASGKERSRTKLP